MKLSNRTRTLVLGLMLAAAVSTSAVTTRPASAEPVRWTGPNGPQCHLKDWTGDGTINPQGNGGWGSVASITIAPIHAAGCTMAPPVQPPPPTPTPTPTGS